tara:strand:- start:365 stop:811 length:447 start_codon:yes stop_codon:yes gene_type:complete
MNKERKIECQLDAVMAITETTDPDGVIIARWDHYGLAVYEVGVQQWAIGTDSEADAACEEDIRALVWAFNADFIASHAPKGIESTDIEALRGDRCEDVNDAFIALIEAGSGMESFIEDAIGCDGRGHFLSSYDGNEYEAGEYYLYRIN